MTLRTLRLPTLAGAAVVALLVTSAAAFSQPPDRKSNDNPPPPRRERPQNAERPQRQDQRPQEQRQHDRPPVQRQESERPPRQPHDSTPQVHQQQLPDRPADRPAPQSLPNSPGRQFGGQPHEQDNGRRFGRQPDAPQQAPGRPNGAPPGQQRHDMMDRPSRPPERSYAPRPGIHVENTPGNRQVYRSPNGGQVHMDHGRVVEVHTNNGAVIHHGPEGYRRVEAVRPGGRTVVVNNYGGGYVQKTVVVSNHSYVQRTYVHNGLVTTRVYRPYVFRPGFVVNVYTPVHYYHPRLYAWAYNPWARPVYYSSWGWGGRPWFGFYAGYFTPAPYYAGPAFWLADYMIAAALDDAYQQRMAARLDMPAGYYSSEPGLTPDVTRAVADEIAVQMREEQAEAQTGGASANGNPFHGGTQIFIANTTIEGILGSRACAVTAGDVLELHGMPPMDAAAAPVRLRAAKRGGCPRGSVVLVGIQDLVEMHNYMREIAERGLADLQRRQGQGGLPPMTAEAAAPATPVSWASQIQPESNVQNELTQVSNDANSAEQDTIDSTVQTPGPDAEPAVVLPAGAPSGRTGSDTNIQVGSTIEQVMAAWGQPDKIADLGSRKIYIYQYVKVTFEDGRVVDVQ